MILINLEIAYKRSHLSMLLGDEVGSLEPEEALLRWWAPSRICSSVGKSPSIRSMVVILPLWSKMSTRDLSLPMMSLASSSLLASSSERRAPAVLDSGTDTKA